MRAREICFKGDQEMLRGVASSGSRPFFWNRKTRQTPNRSSKWIAGADEAAHMLKFQLVQGKRKGEGEYEMNVQPRHTTTDPKKMPRRSVSGLST